MPFLQCPKDSEVFQRHVSEAIVLGEVLLLLYAHLGRGLLTLILTIGNSLVIDGGHTAW